MIEELESNIYEDQTYERVVDFGHTFSPLLETETRHLLSHGQAVAVDMALSTVLSFDMGLIHRGYRDRILDLMHSLGLPVYAPELTVSLCRQALLKATSYRGGRPNLVLPTENHGSFFLKDSEMISDAMLHRGIRKLAEVNA
jgi:3-dehydroquinate synthetase